MTSTNETSVAPAGVDVPAPVGKLASVSLDCNDPAALAEFYGTLLGMRRVFETPDGRIIALSDGTLAVTMMQVENHVAPTWPDPGQQQQVHLDISVTDLERAVTTAASVVALAVLALIAVTSRHPRPGESSSTQPVTRSASPP